MIKKLFLVFIVSLACSPRLFCEDEEFDYRGRINFSSFKVTTELPESKEILGALGCDEKILKRGSIQGTKVSLSVAKVDLNSDGSQDLIYYVSPMGCGSGGCQMALEDGKSHKFLGTVSGYEIYVLKMTVNGFPVLHVPTKHSIASSVFDGNKYVVVYRAGNGKENELPENVPLIK